ncbi:hypothetical protein BDZ45DRAFT_810328 [Acephala macrosclerotiorum]|nr:hypothetical protein BDZ45DRAFT_810328 [Acephala macrosclerotiorum]
MAGSVMALSLQDFWTREMLSLCLFLLTLFASGKYAKYAIFGKDYIWDVLDSLNDTIEDGRCGYVMQSSHGFYSPFSLFISDLSPPTEFKDTNGALPSTQHFTADPRQDSGMECRSTHAATGEHSAGISVGEDDD